MHLSHLFRSCICFSLTLPGLLTAAHERLPAARSQIANGEPNQAFHAAEEAFLRTPPGFDRPGQPRLASGANAGLLNVTVVDRQTDQPTACRVNVVGPDGNYYEPTEQPLQPYNAQHAGCHLHDETHPPSRYYGWYFYSEGQFSVRVPAGKVRIEVWKGYETLPVVEELEVAAGSQAEVRVAIERTAPMEPHGYYSGDTHLHLDRRTDDDERAALALLAAEDIQYGFLLCMNETDAYSGRMDSQLLPQQRGFGADSVRTAGNYGIASGQEYRSKDYGHICLLMHRRLVLQGNTIDPNHWPVFGLVGQRTRALGGYSFHAHGGYSQEIYADYVQHATDGVELLQMAHYRGIGLAGWQRILNIGYRFPALAASDFPYTRCFGDCRTYVYAAQRPDFNAWTQAAAQGRSFFTTGPLLLLEVAGRRPGDVIELAEHENRTLRAKIRVRCEVTHLDQFELIVNGETHTRWTLPRDEKNQGAWHQREIDLSLDGPAWIAARATGISPTGRSDAEAHTNPVYIEHFGRRPFDAASRDWLVERLDEQIAKLREREFAEKPQALAWFLKSRRQLQEMEGGSPTGQ